MDEMWTWDSSTASVVSEWIFGKLKCTGLSERTKVQAFVGTGTTRACHLHEPARDEQTRHMQTGLRVLTAPMTVPECSSITSFQPQLKHCSVHLLLGASCLLLKCSLPLPVSM